MQLPIIFTGFAIEHRNCSPNAVIGFHEVLVGGIMKEKRIFITAPVASLGVELGDLLAEQIKTALEKEYKVGPYNDK